MLFPCVKNLVTSGVLECKDRIGEDCPQGNARLKITNYDEPRFVVLQG